MTRPLIRSKHQLFRAPSVGAPITILYTVIPGSPPDPGLRIPQYFEKASRIATQNQFGLSGLLVTFEFCSRFGTGCGGLIGDCFYNGKYKYVLNSDFVVLQPIQLCCHQSVWHQLPFRECEIC